jgi:hypothetical protein
VKKTHGIVILLKPNFSIKQAFGLGKRGLNVPEVLKDSYLDGTYIQCRDFHCP